MSTKSKATCAFDEQPPSSVATERALLAAMLVDPSVTDSVCQIVTEADFHDHAHGRLYSALVTLREAGRFTADITLTIPALRAMHVTPEKWPTTEIARLIGEGIAAHATHYAEQIRKLSRLRRHRDLACDLIIRAQMPGADPGEIHNWIDTRTERDNQRRAVDAQLIGDVASEVLEDIDQARAKERGIMTGLVSVDEATGGIMPGELAVLAARPGCGKTSLGVQIGLHNARQNRNVLVTSLEMTRKELTQRVLCAIAGVDSRRIRRGLLQSDERKAIVDATTKLQGLAFRIWDPASALTSDIRAFSRLQSKSEGLSLLVVDYVGLVRPSDPGRPRHEQVGEVIGGLKSLAKELSVPVVAMAQLNREAAKGEPTLAMLRESGNIEQDADIVLFLNHEKKNEPVSLIVAKHRHGETGTIPLRWIPHETRFEDSNLKAWNGGA